MEKKRFEVIKIINNYTVMVSNDSFFEIDDEIKIYIEGEELIDYNGKNHGKIKLIKDILTVVICEYNYVICKKIKITPNRLLPVMDTFLVNKKVVSKINVDLDQIQNIIHETNEPIKIGDIAEIV